LKVRADRLKRVDVWGVHDYWDSHNDYWEKRFAELRAFPGVSGKPVWMTEWAQRYRYGDLDSALQYGRNILNALRLGAEAWMVFEWAHPYGNQSGLISADWGEQTGARRYWRSKAYQVFRQIANTTPVGAEVVAMKKTAGDAPVEFLALRDHGRLIVHLVNSDSTAVNCRLRASGVPAASVKAWETTPIADMRSASVGLSVNGAGETICSLPPYSVVTLLQ
jgi:hypothetical protein